MGIFREYGERLDKIARYAINNYFEARKNVEIAEAVYNRENDPHKTLNNYEQQAKASRAKANLFEAQKAVKDARQFMVTEIESIREVGRELQAEINTRFCANGEQVSIGTLELLKSGILKPQEYFSLYDKAQQDGNHTMMRLIGRYAGESAKDAPTKELEMQMTRLANNAQHTMGGEYMTLFGNFLDAYARSANNPAMLNRWDEMTAGIINSF